MADADEETRRLLSVVWNLVIPRAGINLATIVRRYTSKDPAGVQRILPQEFMRGLRELGVRGLTDADCERLFSRFDRDHTGRIDFDDFLVGLRGELAGGRKAIVEAAFRRLDRGGRGVVPLADVRAMYDASLHPDVLNKRRTADEVMREFLDSFSGGRPDGFVTLPELLSYYATVSAHMDSDEYFEQIVRNCWHVTAPAFAGVSMRRVRVTRRDGSQAVIEVPEDLIAGKTPYLLKKFLASKKGLDVVEVELAGLAGGDDDSDAAADSPPTRRGGGGGYDDDGGSSAHGGGGGVRSGPPAGALSASQSPAKFGRRAVTGALAASETGQELWRRRASMDGNKTHYDEIAAASSAAFAASQRPVPQFVPQFSATTAASSPGSRVVPGRNASSVYIA